jgi:hypothetical protein
VRVAIGDRVGEIACHLRRYRIEVGRLCNEALDAVVQSDKTRRVFVVGGAEDAAHYGFEKRVSAPRDVFGYGKDLLDVVLRDLRATERAAFAQ